MNKLKIKSFILAYWPIGLIILVSFSLRLYHLGYHDFWYDEAYTVNFAKFLRISWNPPLYNTLIHFWTKLFGFSETSLRFPSFLFSFFSVITVFFLGRELFGKKVGLLASVFIGLSPFHIWYAQEARDYGMMLFFGTLSSYLLFRALNKNTNKLWFFFALSSLATMLTNYFGLILFLAQCIYVICIVKRRLIFKELFFLLCVILAFSLYSPLFLSKFYYLMGGFWVPKPTLASLVITVENFILGYTGSLYLYLASNILVAVAIIFLQFNFKKVSFAQLFFCIFLLVFPVILIFSFSKILFSIYLDRGLMLFSPYLYLILSLGIMQLKKKWLYSYVFLLVLLMGIADYRYYQDQLFSPIYHHIGSYVKKPIREVAVYLDKNVGAGDLIYYTNESVCPLLTYYMKTRHQFFRIIDPAYVDTNWNRVYKEGYGNILYYKMAEVSFDSLWVIFTNWSRNGELELFSMSIKKWLEGSFRMISSKDFGGLLICRFEKIK